MPPSPPTLLLARKGHDFPSTPGFGAFSMEMKPSPAASTTHLRPVEEEEQCRTPSRESFAKQRAPADLRPLRIVQWSRIVLSVLLVAAGAAVVGCEAHALHSYNVTHLGEDWFLPLWPQDLDLRPSVAILVGGGALVVLTGCLSLCCAVVQRVGPVRWSFLLNVLFIVISLLGLVAAAFATGFSARIYHANNSSNGRDTIQSWACRWYDGAQNNHNNNNVQIASTAHTNGTTASQQGATGGAVSSPTGFGRLCLESHAAFDLTVLTLLLEVGAVGLNCAAYWLERKMR